MTNPNEPKANAFVQVVLKSAEANEKLRDAPHDDPRIVELMTRADLAYAVWRDSSCASGFGLRLVKGHGVFDAVRNGMFVVLNAVPRADEAAAQRLQAAYADASVRPGRLN